MKEIITKRYPVSITKRYLAAEKITKRFFIPGVTRRFQSHIASTRNYKPQTIKINSLIAGIYKVLDGPLGATSGEADVYACRDENSAKKKAAIVAIKLYRYHTQPKQQVIQQLQGLVHPNLVSLKGSGQWRGQFYEVMEYYQGGVLSEQKPYDEAQLKQWLADIIAGLHYCHQQGIVHRDIKPNNLFFRDASKQSVLIGDFGISSYLEDKNSSVRVTTTAANLTLDYAAPELLDGHSIGPKTDYYALGITLIHLLLGQSPFTGFSSNDILIAHLRGRIPQIDRLKSDGLISDEFQQLLSGLLVHDARYRWGFREIIAWLQGTPVPLKKATLFKAEYPYPGYQKAKNPKELAVVLHLFNAERQLFRSDIQHWIRDHFDAQLANKVAELEEKYIEYPSKALVKLRYLLDPELPLVIKKKPIKSINELLNVLIDAPESLFSHYRNEEISAWIEAGNLANERTRDLLKQLESIRKRLPYNKKAAMHGLLYTLAPHRPVQLGHDAIKHPNEIKSIYLKDHLTTSRALQTLLFTRELEEWIRAAQFKNWQQDVTFLESCRAHYLGNQGVGTQCALWYFYPQRSFPFAGKKTNKPSILALLIDQSDKHRQIGLKLLQKGWIRAWLVGTGKIKPDTEFDQLMNNDALKPSAKLEIVLRMLNPNFKPPELHIDQEIVNFGVLEEDDERIQSVVINNKQRGELSGEISLQQFSEGLIVNKFHLDGNETILSITVNSLGLDPGSYHNKIKLTTNGGNKEINVHFKVNEKQDERAWWQKLIDD